MMDKIEEANKDFSARVSDLMEEEEGICQDCTVSQKKVPF